MGGSRRRRQLTATAISPGRAPCPARREETFAGTRRWRQQRSAPVCQLPRVNVHISAHERTAVVAVRCLLLSSLSSPAPVNLLFLLGRKQFISGGI
jgi:hypothetical protein